MLRQLDANDLKVIRDDLEPSQELYVIMYTVLVFIDEKHDWETLRQVMLEENFMNRVAEFDPGNEEQMTEKKLDWLRKYSPRNLDFK